MGAGRPKRSKPSLKKLLRQHNSAKAAAFDTRLSTKLVGIFGYAADKIATNLKSNGWTIVFPPKGFFVKGKKGPLLDGELEHAVDWAKEIVV